jgi:hypothetical protein
MGVLAVTRLAARPRVRKTGRFSILMSCWGFQLLQYVRKYLLSEFPGNIIHAGGTRGVFIISVLDITCLDEKQPRDGSHSSYIHSSLKREPTRSPRGIGVGELSYY